jgi:ribosome-associated toxin RatA of RatAB toxin-antitoxin module
MTMRTVNRSALVPYSATAMFKLVCDVEAYPEFLPWCSSTQLLSKSATDLSASLQIGYGALNSEFTTANEFTEPDWMTMRLIDGPFSSLEGRWDFTELGDDGCEVNLKIEFAFSNPVKDMLFGATFETICNELIDAFTKRARQLYD